MKKSKNDRSKEREGEKTRKRKRVGRKKQLGFPLVVESVSPKSLFLIDFLCCCFRERIRE